MKLVCIVQIVNGKVKKKKIDSLQRCKNNGTKREPSMNLTMDLVVVLMKVVLEEVEDVLNQDLKDNVILDRELDLNQEAIAEEVLGEVILQEVVVMMGVRDRQE